MARSASPWFWERRNCWAVIVDGQRHVLGDHPPDAPPPRKKNKKWVVPAAIQQRFHELKAAPAGQPPAAPKAACTVGEVFEKFLVWCEANRSERTLEWSRNHIQSFCDALQQREERILPRTFPAADLAPFHVTEWVDANRQKRTGKRAWGPNHCRGAIIAVKRAFSWAEKQGHIPKSPVRGVEMPQARRREQVLTQADFDALLAHVQDAAFRDVLTFCWESGARVQEVRLIRAEHFKADRGRVELPPKDAKGKKRWRIIYLTDLAEGIVRRLCLAHPDGPIFRSTDGEPWEAQNFNCRFFRLQRRLGREKLGGVTPDPDEVAALARTLPKTKTEKGKVVPKSHKELLREARKKLSGAAAAKAGTKYALTAIRHSFATRMLEAGVDHLTVSALLGHADGAMLAKVYSHVGEKTDFLREELRRGSGGGTAAA